MSTTDRKPEVLGYDAVRKAARNTRDYSSDLLGDTDMRWYRHLPLEADAPRHTQLRLALTPWFAEDRISALSDMFKDVARSIIAKISANGGGEVGVDIALPLVMNCLAHIYNRHQDLDEWISWGPNTWFPGVWMKGEAITEESKRAQRERNYTLTTQRSTQTIDDYIMRVLDEAEANPRPYQETGDVWDFVSQIEPGGSRLSREEMLGIGSVLLSGGRDTLIKLITGIVWHLVRSPEDRQFLTDNPDERLKAIHEIARYLTPLPRLERLIPGAEDDSPENRTMLSFASANFDRTVFEDPETVNIHRAPKPTLAFGFGKHSCLGVQVTEIECLAFLEVLLNDWPGWEFSEEPALEWVTEREDDGDAAFRILDEFTSVLIVSP